MTKELKPRRARGFVVIAVTSIAALVDLLLAAHATPALAQSAQAVEAAAVGRHGLFSALPGDQAIEDDAVLVGLGRVIDRMTAGGFDGGDSCAESLGLEQTLSRHPVLVFLALGRQQETNLAHEDLARLAVD